MGKISDRAHGEDQSQEVSADWQARIDEHINHYAGTAWEGYKAHGRGPVYLNLLAPSLCEHPYHRRLADSRRAAAVR